ncbi:hypothetical protein F1880_000370 [Penicillium rolfsii]|nr:hypothetical protein F1880_000370 [Penicillium rolfsii]
MELVYAETVPRALKLKIAPLKGDQQSCPPVVNGGRQLRRIDTSPETTSNTWGPPVFANRRASIEPRITAQNEDMFRTFHPALRSEPEVFALTRKPTNHQVWLVFPRKGDSGPFPHVGGRAVYTQPYFETPTEHGMKYALTKEDPIPRHIDVNEPLPMEDLVRVKRLFPRAIGIQIFQCECVIVWFREREDMAMVLGRTLPKYKLKLARAAIASNPNNIATSTDTASDISVYHFATSGVYSQWASGAICGQASILGADDKLPVFVGQWALQSLDSTTFSNRDIFSNAK